MHAVDVIILGCVGQVVGWVAGLYVDPDLRRLGGHVIVATIAAWVFGWLALRLTAPTDKLAMILIGAAGAAAALYLIRYRWRHKAGIPGIVDQDQ